MITFNEVCPYWFQGGRIMVSMPISRHRGQVGFLLTHQYPSLSSIFTGLSTPLSAACGWVACDEEYVRHYFGQGDMNPGIPLTIIGRYFSENIHHSCAKLQRPPWQLVGAFCSMSLPSPGYLPSRKPL